MPRKKRSEEEIQAIILECSEAILVALRSGIDRFKLITPPDGRSETDMRLALGFLKEAGKVQQVGKKRGARYYLAEHISEDGSSPERVKPTFLPSEKIDEFIGSMRRGLMHSLTPRDAAVRFAERFGFDLSPAWDEINKAIRAGKMQITTIFDNGYRIHCYMEHEDG